MRVKTFFVLLVALFLFATQISRAGTFTCVIHCKGDNGQAGNVKVKVEAQSLSQAEKSFLGVIDLSYSKAATICKDKGFKGLLIQKGKKIVECK